MATLSITYTFIPGNIIRASEHNQNMTDILTWANGNITDNNFSTFTGAVTWNVSTNVKSIISTNTGTAGSASFAQNGTLSSGLSAFKISSNVAQSAGSALLELLQSNAAANIPSLLITDSGVQGPALKVISTTKPVHVLPTMTNTQRNALNSPSEGDMVYSSTDNGPEFYASGTWHRTAAIKGIFTGAFSSTSNWTNTGTPFDGLNSGGNALTTRVALYTLSGVAAAGSNVCGLTWTPNSTSAVYIIKATPILKSNSGAATMAYVVLTDGSVEIARTGMEMGETHTRVPAHLHGVYMPNTTSPVTVRVYIGGEPGVQGEIGGSTAGSGTDCVTWEIIQIA